VEWLFLRMHTQAKARQPLLTRRRVLTGFGAAATSALALGGYAFAVEPMWRLSVTRYRVTPPRWPKGLKLSVGVIADIHASEPVMPVERVAAIAERTMALRPDIIVLLGDFAGHSRFQTKRVPPEAWSEALSSLRAPLGVHAVLGNHDWWEDYLAQSLRHGPTVGHRVLERVGIPVYENDVVRLKKDGQAFWLAGLGDQLAFIDRSKRGFARFRGVDDLRGTLAKVTDDAPVILLAHEPDIFPVVPDRVALTLSGHTHGGQERVLGYSPIVPSRYGNRYAYGHVVEDNRHLIVSGGLGCSKLPVRFGVPPEIVMIDVSA
jgi:predicted MPP superfamily phosphohydrolase